MQHGHMVGRLFLAVPLDERVRKGLADFLHGATGGKPLPGRAPQPQNWHLTLRFLGDVVDTLYQSLLSGIDKKDLGEPFEVVFGGLGAFPRPSRGSVLWVGIDQGSEPLCRLAASVEEAAVQAGFPPEDRPFSPHLTLSRLRPSQNLDHLIQKAGVSGMQMTVNEIVLYRSHLGSSGARYEPLQRFVLRSAA